jgi:hypothetical protein
MPPASLREQASRRASAVAHLVLVRRMLAHRRMNADDSAPNKGVSATAPLILGVIAWVALIGFFLTTTSAERNSGYSFRIAILACSALGCGALFALLGCIVCHILARRALRVQSPLWLLAFVLNYGFFLFTVPWLIIGYQRGLAAGHQLP